MIVIKLTVCTDSAGTTQDFLFCNGESFTTKPSDTPANTFCDSSLMSAGEFTSEMFSGTYVQGGVRSGFGSITINNLNARYDSWVSYAVGGRDITFWMGEDGAAFPSGFELVRAAKMSHFEMSHSKIDIILRDRMLDFDKPMCTQLFSGYGVLNGTAAMAGKRRPKGYGHVFGAGPTLVDPNRLIYQLSSSFTTDLNQYVRDNGYYIGTESAYTSESDLINTSPSEGYVRKYPAGGYFRLGSVPVGQITAEAVFHTDNTASSLLEQVALDAGVVAGDIDTISLLGLPGGYYSTGDETTFLEVMARIAEGSGLYFGWTRLGKFYVGQLTDPASGSSAGTIIDQQLLSLDRSMPSGMESPVKTVIVKYMRNWSPVSTPATGLAPDWAALIKAAESSYEVSDLTVLTKHPYAKILSRDTYSFSIGGWGAPTTEASRVLDLFKKDREVYDARMKLDTTTMTYDIGSVVTLKYPRFGLSAGKKFAVIRTRTDYNTNQVTLGLWG